MLEPFFNKAKTRLRLATLLIRKLRNRCFSVKFVNNFKNTFFIKQFLATSVTKIMSIAIIEEER